MNIQDFEGIDAEFAAKLHGTLPDTAKAIPFGVSVWGNWRCGWAFIVDRFVIYKLETSPSIIVALPGLRISVIRRMFQTPRR